MRSVLCIHATYQLLVSYTSTDSIFNQKANFYNPLHATMDDPISALDANVRKLIFKEVFQGLLRDKTRILVTHAVDFLHLSDRIIVMSGGSVQAFGTFKDL